MIVIRAKGGFRGYLDDHVAFMGRFVGLVLDVPAECVEKGVEEVDTYLSFGIALLEVVGFVLIELSD